MSFTRAVLACVSVVCLVVSLAASASASPLTYTVRAGDTLTSIAARFDTTVAAIAEANGLRDLHTLRIGQVLRIPGGRATPSEAIRTHTVRSGDTLWAIASRFGVPVSALVRANNLPDAHQLRIGQVLRIPGGPVPPSAATAQDRPAAPQAAPRTETQTHTVRAGDTLWEIARRHGTTPQRIAALNGISEAATLQIGQRLRVPVRPATIQTEPQATRRVAAASSRGVMLVSMARRFLGTPYRWGATGNGAFDCSGFVFALFRNKGMTLPRTSAAMFRVGRPVARADLRQGDLVFFTTHRPGPSHVGIYMGSSYFIHASSAGRGVRIDSLRERFYNARFIGARRHF